jgi:hypothetical protein
VAHGIMVVPFVAGPNKLKRDGGTRLQISVRNEFDRKSSLKSTARSSAVTHKLLPSSYQSYMENPEGM